MTNLSYLTHHHIITSSHHNIHTTPSKKHQSGVAVVSFLHDGLFSQGSPPVHRSTHLQNHNNQFQRPTPSNTQSNISRYETLLVTSLYCFIRISNLTLPSLHRILQMSTNDFFNFCGDIVQRVTDRELELIKQVCHYVGKEELIDEVQEHFVYKDLRKKCLKQKKDLNAPKKPRTSYMIFCADVREKVASENPTLKMTELSKKLGERWASTTDEVKEEFQKRADEEKEKYKQEEENYKKKLHEQKGSFSGVGASNSSELSM